MADLTQQEFNEMLAVAIAGGLGGGTYISRWDGEQIDDGVDKVLLPGGITTTELADGAVTWPKLAVDARPIRDDLLINSYFVGGGSQQGGGQFPINARGQMIYANGGYTIDGWRHFGGGRAEIVDGGIKLSQSAPYQVYWGQVFEPYVSQALAGKTATFSFLCTVNDGIGINVFDGDEWIGGSSSQIGLNTTTITLPNNLTNLRFLFGGSVAGSVIIQAVKMELGDHQTLAHQDANGNLVPNAPPPDFALELLRCQRYFQTFATQSLRPTKGADFRPVMRTENPTLGTITLPDGTVLYTASSEL